MDTTLDTIKKLLERNGGSVNFDNPKGILLDYEFSEEGEEYAVYAKEIFLKGDHIYAKCASCLAESELYDPSFTEDYRVNSTNVENVKEQIYSSAINEDIIPPIEEQDGIPKVYYAYLNNPAYEAAEEYPLTKDKLERQRDFLIHGDDEDTMYPSYDSDPYDYDWIGDEMLEELENYEKNIFPIIEKYSSLSEDERKELNLDPKLSHQLDCLLMIRNDRHCLPSLRLQEQDRIVNNKQTEYSSNLDDCQAVYPGTQNKLFSHSPYIVTDVKFSTPPYVDGKPLCICPGWQGYQASFGHIDSITIENGNGKKVTFSGEQIDKDNNLVFELKDMTVKYGIKTGEARIFPHPKESETEAQRQAQQQKQKQQKPKRRRMHI